MESRKLQGSEIWGVRASPSVLNLEVATSADGIFWAALAAERPEAGVLSLRNMKKYSQIFPLPWEWNEKPLAHNFPILSDCFVSKCYDPKSDMGQRMTRYLFNIIPKHRLTNFLKDYLILQGIIPMSDLLVVKLLSRVRYFATPWTVAYQAPSSMEFSRQEYWSGLPFPSPVICRLLLLWQMGYPSTWLS